MKKNKTIRTVICVCLIALLLIGGAAYGAVRYVDGRIQQLNQDRVADTGAVSPVSMEAESPISQMANLQLNPRSGELLDPTEIYELATQQVVGISTEVTSPNAFGPMVTGAISGNRPYSAWKIFFLVLFIVAVVALLLFFLNAQ